MESIIKNEKECNESTLKIHRVGSITAGIVMIVFGILFIIHMFMPQISYELIYRCWPIILIGLGIEMLASNAFSKKYIYDKGAVFILIIMSFFSMIMAGFEFVVKYAEVMY